jgi:heme exporter protein A
MIASLTVDELALKRGQRLLFTELNFALTAGEAAVLTGANGAGKTSLLRAVAGLLRPEGGRIAFADRAGAALDPDEARAGAVHLLGHHDGLKSQRTAGDELDFWTRWLGGTPDAAAHAIDTLALGPLLPLEVRVLSAGQRRRLALARLIAAPRPLWLLDEPMAPLDAARRAQFGVLMAEQLRGGGMILAAVHDPLPVPATAIEVGR